MQPAATKELEHQVALLWKKSLLQCKGWEHKPKLRFNITGYCIKYT